jgi:hypothetical protein
MKRGRGRRVPEVNKITGACGSWCEHRLGRAQTARHEIPSPLHHSQRFNATRQGIRFTPCEGQSAELRQLRRLAVDPLADLAIHSSGRRMRRWDPRCAWSPTVQARKVRGVVYG